MSGSVRGPMRTDQIAIQLYTVRDLVARDLPGTIGQLAGLGYRAVEFAGLAGCDPSTARAALDANHIRAASAHVPFEALQGDLSAELDVLDTLGCARVVIPSVPPRWHSGGTQVRDLALRIGELAAACAARGFSLAYHNHDSEFAPLDGTTMWDVLVGALEEEVELEVDVYWAARAGRDPVALIEGQSSRVALLHMKDMGPGADRRDVPVGDGILPWDAILGAGRRAGVEWYVVEQDHPTDPIVSARRGLAFLNGLTRGGPAAESSGP